MTPPLVLRRATSALALLSVLAAPLAAQNVLFTDYNGKFLAVMRAHGNTPFVEAGGKLVAGDGQRYTLQKAPEYLPYFVSVRDFTVKTRHLNTDGSELNHEFLLQGKLESPLDLDDVFIVLEMHSERAGKVLFLQEVGNLAAGEQKTVTVTTLLASAIGEGKYQFHLFSHGHELLHSRMPSLQRDEALDRMTLRRIAGVQDAAPQPLIGPGPEYPPELLKAGNKGQAIIALRIGANGQVYDPKVKSATDPAFGEAALVAARLWRFLPRVKAGRPVETSVELPFNFSPPGKSAKDSCLSSGRG